MSQPRYRYPNFARLGTGARRAMWLELELFWTGTPEARAQRVEQEKAFGLGEPITFPFVDLTLDTEDETMLSSLPSL